MTQDTPLSPLPRTDAGRSLVTAHRLRERGVTAAETAGRCRPGGPWREVLPGVYLLHPGPPSTEERLRAAVLYAAERGPSVPHQGGGVRPGARAMLTGPAALALHGVAAAPPLPSLNRLHVLVGHGRRLRSAGFARVVRAAELPGAEEVDGLPVAPVARALADTVATLTDAAAVRHLVTEAVRDGHAEAAAVVGELRRARLAERPHVVDTVTLLLAGDRARAEDRLYALVRHHGLPDPLWNVGLRLPDGPHLGGVDAYWPAEAVAVEIDTAAPDGDGALPGAAWNRKREQLERLGVTVVRCTPDGLRRAPAEQAVVVRTALMAAVDRDPAAVVIAPR
ncbi:hypothetical protein [Streptomyces sp. NPDC014733]|uniref:hypothetical protein n=1 Tax=Streptomyces sp. NPDC014733 TaxID=3364885 RepID=UPI0036FC96B9